MKLSFSLFPNKQKVNPKAPDYWMAQADVIEITEPGAYRLVSWQKPMKDGTRTYLSCSLEKVAEGQAPSKQANLDMIRETQMRLAAEAAEKRPVFPNQSLQDAREEELPF